MKKKTWEKEFNKMMFEHEDGGVTLSMTKVKLESFITQLLKQKEKEVIEKMEVKVKNVERKLNQPLTLAHLKQAIFELKEELLNSLT